MKEGVAVAISTLIFGLAHAYQGRSGVIQAGLAGLVVAGLYLLTGSLWVSMALHAATDIFGGLTSYEALKEERSPVAA